MASGTGRWIAPETRFGAAHHSKVSDLGQLVGFDASVNMTSM
jgi:hypothetical protein